MGLGSFDNICKKLHKRKRNAAATPRSTVQEEWSSSSSEIDDRAAEVFAEACNAQHHGGRRQCSDRDDDQTHGNEDDDDENSDGSSSTSSAHAFWEAPSKDLHCSEDHGDAGSVSNESCMHFEDDQGVSMDHDGDDAPQFNFLEGNFLLSSGRSTRQQETLCGTTIRHTIDSEFEEYFAALLLK